MKLERLFFAYFSPTGGTRRVMRRMLAAARGTGLFLEELDLTLPESHARAHAFGEGDAVFFASPCYYGRVPTLVAEDFGRHFLSSRPESRAVGIPVTVFGNRAYEDGLREAGDLMRAAGFAVAAGAAFVARHSVYPKLAAGRPSDQDELVMKRFVNAVIEKILSAETTEALTSLQKPFPGEGPYRPGGSVPAVPMPDPQECCRCGSCAEKCPAGIIDPQTFIVTSPEECLACRACITACPDQARDFPEPVRSRLEAMLEKIAAANAAPKAPELFL